MTLFYPQALDVPKCVHCSCIDPVILALFLSKKRNLPQHPTFIYCLKCRALGGGPNFFLLPSQLSSRIFVIHMTIVALWERDTEKNRLPPIFFFSSKPASFGKHEPPWNTSLCCGWGLVWVFVSPTNFHKFPGVICLSCLYLTIYLYDREGQGGVQFGGAIFLCKNSYEIWVCILFKG